MSLARFLTDRVAIERPVELPSGEFGPPSAPLVEDVPCRIRGATQSDTMHLAADVIAAGVYMAEFDEATRVVPQTNDVLVREGDDRRFLVVGFADFMGERGHAMAHYRVPVRRAG